MKPDQKQLSGSGWSCNELGILLVLQIGDEGEALSVWGYGCALGFSAACDNAARLAAGSTTFASASLTPSDLPIVLRVAKGRSGSRTRRLCTS